MRSNKLSAGRFALLAAAWLAGYGAIVSGAGVAAAIAQDSQGEVTDSTGSAPAEVLELKWEHLIPADYRPYDILKKYDVETLTDSDPRAAEMMGELRTALDAAPVVTALDGKQVSLPGFVVPLEHDGDKLSEFLLVPYFGACIHVPPPPANQIVYVTTARGEAVAFKLFDVVQVTGRLSAKGESSKMGIAGYRLQASRVEAYKRRPAAGQQPSDKSLND